MRFFWYVACVVLCGLVFPGRAQAHQAGLSRGEYRLDGAMFTAEIIFARGEVALLARDLDEDGDGSVSAAEVQKARKTLNKTLTPKLVVKAGNEVCQGSLDDAFLVEEDGLSVRMVYLCPTPPASVHMRFDVLDVLAFGHRHIARAESGAVIVEEVFFGTKRDWELSPAASPASGTRGDKPAATQSIGAYFLMGIEHILLGYDHLVFLLGLVLVGGRWKSLLLVITAFTLAHSLTLGLAVLDVWAPSPRIVEPLIALSVAYVGVENQFVKDAEKRWRITFPFGLIHGFGFAGALGEIQLPKADVPKALLGFNLGVEAGQLATLAIVLPLLHVARERKWFDQRGVRYASWAICALGLVWFVVRVTGN